MSKLKVYLITGEPSGDLLGSRLMRALKTKTKGAVAFYGVGGETMESEGLKPLFDIADLAVMGFFEVLPSLPRILRHMDEIIADIRTKKPDIIVTVDSYSFNASIHKLLKKENIQIPHVHYVAPQVWAWKKGRAKKIATFVDHLFCLLPNEPAYFTPYGMAATFVGHPVIEGGAAQGDGKKFKRDYMIHRNTKVVCMLPGSRKNEVQYLLPIFMQAVEKLAHKYPDICVVVPTVKTVADKVKDVLKSWSIPSFVVEGETERYNAFAATDVAIAASGTVSLELAMANVPHLIAYRVNPLTGLLARVLLKIKYVNLINILSNKEVIPELLQEKCNADAICKVAKQLMGKKYGGRAYLKPLGVGLKQTPSENVADLVIDLAHKGQKQ